MDTRIIGQKVKCKKTFRNTFIEGEYYDIHGFLGDPEAAIAAGLGYLPVEFINIVWVLDKDAKKHKFSINLHGKYYQGNKYKNFFKYFDIVET